MWCPHCKTEYDGEVSLCPDCGAALVEYPPQKKAKAKWSLKNKDKDELKWPIDAEGNPEKGEFLAHCTSVNMEDNIMRNLLAGYGIPSLVYYPNDGGFSKVILGISGLGADIYVPESMIEDARSLVGGNEND